MTQTILILGANGRFGRAATLAFADAGWRVRAASRQGKGAVIDSVRNIACDVLDQAAVVSAARGADVIVHAVHPAYPEWAALMPVHTENVIAAGLASGATVMIPANVYTFGQNASVTLHEDDAPAPTTRKGALRVTMERSFQGAAEQGLRTVVLRAGDFIERTKSGNWFDSYIANKTDKGVFTYPGRMDVVHAWAYLPDMARAMVGLAHKRADLAPFSSFGFEGFSVTGEEMKAAIECVLDRPLRTATFPWPLMRVIGLFSPLVREVNEMRYLWDTPHRVDGAPLRVTLPEFTPTPLETALANVLGKTQTSPLVMDASVPRSA